VKADDPPLQRTAAPDFLELVGAADAEEGARTSGIEAKRAPVYCTPTVKCWSGKSGTSRVNGIRTREVSQHAKYRHLMRLRLKEG
jgi:hypothetical protein